MMLQRDGKVLVIRSYDDSTGIDHAIFRLNCNGSLDHSFNASLFTTPDCAPYCSPTIVAAAIQSDGEVVVVGSFIAVSGVRRPGIARLNGDGRYVRPNSVTQMTDGSARVTINSQPGTSYLLQASTDLRQWMDLRTEPAGGYTLALDDPAAAAFSQRFYRVVLLTP